MNVAKSYHFECGIASRTQQHYKSLNGFCNCAVITCFAIKDIININHTPISPI